MKRLGILTAGGDTPALNATLLGAVHKANECSVELIGLLSGFQSLYRPDVPHLSLNPGLVAIPELDATRGGTILGSSRTYVDESDPKALATAFERLQKLNLDGLVCVGGDGTLNGMQPLCECLPTVLAPKTIDNDLGLNYLGEASEWYRREDVEEIVYTRREAIEGQNNEFALDSIVNYVTPGYATAVFVAADGIQRVRTTAESHRRIAIVEVMGRHSGFIAIGAGYGQPDIVLIPEACVDVGALARKVEEICRYQQHAVIVCGEGIRDTNGDFLGNARRSSDPAGNQRFAGAAESLKQLLLEEMPHSFLRELGGFSDPDTALFTRKVGHTQRGGRPLSFDRYHATQLGYHAVEMLVAGQNNRVATLQWNARDLTFLVDDFDAGVFRDEWGEIHPRTVHPDLYDADNLNITSTAHQYLQPIFNQAIGADDMEFIRQSLFDSGNLHDSFQSVNVKLQNRIQRLG
jgi:ATP-dependent phosphofructokinase / diphosphate-dependent phosphofructokinase